MKRLLVIVVAILLIIGCISGCTYGSYIFIKSYETSGSNSWQISYEKFNGFKQRNIKLSDEDGLTFNVEIETNSGVFGLVIVDSDGTSIYSGDDLPTSSFSVKADSAGKYTIRVNTDNHSGSFNITWE